VVLPLSFLAVWWWPESHEGDGGAGLFLAYFGEMYLALVMILLAAGSRALARAVTVAIVVFTALIAFFALMAPSETGLWVLLALAARHWSIARSGGNSPSFPRTPWQAAGALLILITLLVVFEGAKQARWLPLFGRAAETWNICGFLYFGSVLIVRSVRMTEHSRRQPVLTHALPPLLLLAIAFAMLTWNRKNPGPAPSPAVDTPVMLRSGDTVMPLTGHIPRDDKVRRESPATAPALCGDVRAVVRGLDSQCGYYGHLPPWGRPGYTLEYTPFFVTLEDAAIVEASGGKQLLMVFGISPRGSCKKHLTAVVARQVGSGGWQAIMRHQFFARIEKACYKGSFMPVEGGVFSFPLSHGRRITFQIDESGARPEEIAPWCGRGSGTIECVE